MKANITATIESLIKNPEEEKNCMALQAENDVLKQILANIKTEVDKANV